MKTPKTASIEPKMDQLANIRRRVDMLNGRLSTIGQRMEKLQALAREREMQLALRANANSPGNRALGQEDKGKGRS
jgi:hypothetical protein